MTTPNSDPRRLLDRAALLSATSNRTLMESLYALGASCAEAQAAVNVALAAAIPLAVVEGPRAADTLEGTPDAEALKDDAVAAALAHLAHAGAALTAYGEALDERERQDVTAHLAAAARCWPVDLDALDAGCEVSRRYHGLRAELHALDAERVAVAQGWQAAG